MDLYKRLISYFKPYWKQLLLTLFFTFLYVFANYSSYWVSITFVGNLFEPSSLVETEPAPETENLLSDELGINETQNLIKDKINGAIESLIQAETLTGTLINTCLVIFIAFFLKNIAMYFRRLSLYIIQLSIVVKIRQELHETLMRLPLSFFHSRHTGKMTSVVFNDVNAVQQVLKDSFVKLVNHPIQIIFNLILLFILSPRLTIISFILIPISAALIYFIGQSIRRKSRRVFKQISVVMASFQESLSAIRIVKAFTGEKKEINRFQQSNHGYYKKELRAKRLSFLTGPLNETIGVAIFCVLLWYGGKQVYAGDGITAKDFMLFLALMFALFQPLRELAGLNNVIQTGMAASERIFELIDAKREVYEKPNSKVLDGFHSYISIQDVNFSYDQDLLVLKDINLDIQKGEMVAFVGHSGVGKSTLVDLIPRFYDVSSGSIQIDGTDIREFTLTSLRDKIGIVTQETILFNDTIRMNISYGVQDFTDQQVIDAAKNANAWEFIQDMEKGLSTIIGERGTNLSGGQRQRISIARAILKNTPILILDEATSALDTKSEKLVQNAIDNLMQNRTVLAIAHRLSTIIHADKIVVMYKGRIVDVGKHDELLDRCPVYQSLYNMQFNS